MKNMNMPSVNAGNSNSSTLLIVLADVQVSHQFFHVEFLTNSTDKELVTLFIGSKIVKICGQKVPRFQVLDMEIATQKEYPSLYRLLETLPLTSRITKCIEK